MEKTFDFCHLKTEDLHYSIYGLHVNKINILYDGIKVGSLKRVPVKEHAVYEGELFGVPFTAYFFNDWREWDCVEEFVERVWDMVEEHLPEEAK